MRIQRLAVVSALALPFAFATSNRLSSAQDEQEPSCVQERNCVEQRPLVQTTLTDADDHDLNNIPHQYGHGDGVRAAHDDLRQGLAADPNRHYEYRNPWEIKRLRAPYQYGFLEGYYGVYRDPGNGSRHHIHLPDRR